MKLEAEDQSAASTDVIPHACILAQQNTPDAGPNTLVRDDNGEWEDNEEPEDKTEEWGGNSEWYDIIDEMIDKDINTLSAFIGINTYRYVFENPV